MEWNWNCLFPLNVTWGIFAYGNRIMERNSSKFYIAKVVFPHSSASCPWKHLNGHEVTVARLYSTSRLFLVCVDFTYSVRKRTTSAAAWTISMPLSPIWTPEKLSRHVKLSNLRVANATMETVRRLLLLLVFVWTQVPCTLLKRKHPLQLSR